MTISFSLPNFGTCEKEEEFHERCTKTRETRIQGNFIYMLIVFLQMLLYFDDRKVAFQIAVIWYVVSFRQNHTVRPYVRLGDTTAHTAQNCEVKPTVSLSLSQ